MITRLRLPRDDEVVTTLAIVLFAIIAGSAFLFTHAASASVPAATLTLIRLVVGSAGLVVSHVLCLGGASATISHLRNLFCTGRGTHIFALGALNTTIPYTLYAVAAESGIDVSVMATISGMSPLVAAILAARFIPSAEPLCVPLRVTGLLFGFTGALLVALKSDLANGSAKTTTVLGVAAQVMAVASKAAAAILAEYAFKSSPAPISEAGVGLGVARRGVAGAAAGGTAAGAAVDSWCDADYLSTEDQQAFCSTAADSASPPESFPVIPLSHDTPRHLLQQPLSSTVVAMGQAISGAILALPLALAWDFWLVPSRGSALLSANTDWSAIAPALAYLGLAGSCAVYFLQFFVLERAGGVRQIACVDFLTPAVGVTEGALINCDFCDLGTTPRACVVLGATLGVCGVGLFQSDAFIVQKKKKEHSLLVKVSKHDQQEQPYQQPQKSYQQQLQQQEEQQVPYYSQSIGKVGSDAGLTSTASDENDAVGCTPTLRSHVYGSDRSSSSGGEGPSEPLLADT